MVVLAAAGLPRAGIQTGTGGHVIDTYWALFVKAGITFEMLKLACEGYVMAHRKPGETKFYPDPGQLHALCADDLKDAARKRGTLTRAREELLRLFGAMDEVEAQPRPLRTAAEILASRAKPAADLVKVGGPTE